MSIEKRLSELGIELPETQSPIASYTPVKIVAGMAFVSGQVARVDGAVLHPGKVGSEVSIEQAQEAARVCALQALSALREALGGFERLVGIVKVEVFVASAPGFTGQPLVANGASDVLAEVLDDAGVHARAAVGVAELPLGTCVEVALVAEVR